MRVHTAPRTSNTPAAGPLRANASPRTPITSQAAGPFDVELDFQFKCNVRKGDIRENPRGGTLVEFKAKISEGLGVAKAKVLSFVQRTLPSALLISDELYFKRSKGAAQSEYLALTEANFERMTKSRWYLISKGDVSSWSDNGKRVLEGFFFTRPGLSKMINGQWNLTGCEERMSG